MKREIPRALIFDLDGTAVLSREDAIPSQVVIDAVKEAKNRVKVSSASGRSLDMCIPIWKALGLTDPCIVNGGSQIVSPISYEILWEQYVPEDAVYRIVESARGHDFSLIIGDQQVNHNQNNVSFLTKTNMVACIGVNKESTMILTESFAHIPDIAVHVVPSWVGPHVQDIHITHALATKGHAVERLIEMLGVKKEETIGVGDSSNDLPLFRAVGFKVAMGNASDELKSQADFVTDTVDNDGLAKIIRDYIP